jgi:hypothetical protein
MTEIKAMRKQVLKLMAAALLLLIVCLSLLGRAASASGSGDNSNAGVVVQPGQPAGVAPGGTAQPAGPFSFVEPTVRLPASSQAGTGEIILQSSTAQAAPPTLKDVDLPHPQAATVTFDLINDSNAPPNTWRYRATVYGLAASASQQHYADVIFAGTKKQTLIYTLTNQPAGSFAWSISKLPDPWVASGDRACTALSVTTKDAPATDVKVFSTLVEQSTKEAITLDNLRLCVRGSNCDAPQPITLPANVPTELQLCTTTAFHGNFHGAVILASRQKPDGDIILQNAQFSSFWAKLLGFILIFAGVLVAFWAKVWSRARLERDQALMPAILMRSQLDALQEALDQLKPVYHDVPVNIRTAIQDLRNELDDNVLDSRQFLPPSFPNPFGFSVDAAGYKAYLEARNPRVQLLSVLVKEGVVVAAAEDNGTLSDAQQTEVATAIRNIDAISTAAPSPDQALQQVQPILTTLHATLSGIPVAQAALVPASTSRSFEALQLEIQTISKGIWLLYGILTALSGLAVLILNNPGYGVPLDFVFAFFWGFGLPTTIQSLAPGSAATALNISIAKGS